jgi:hypothetical protein
LDNVIVPDSVKIIEDKAFSYCLNLRNIYIPSSVESIQNNTFESCNVLTIYGNPQSYANTFANINNIRFVSEVDFTLTKGFVNRLYDKVLQRGAESSGLQYWSDMLLNKTLTGASITYQFINSPEFVGRNLNNSDYIEILYQAIFNRASDESGKNYWLDLIASGRSRLFILSNFIQSAEFAELCNNAGIAVGSIDLSSEQFPTNNGVQEFINRCYTVVLQRDADQSGMDYWTNILTNHIASGAQVASGFIFSGEFTSRNLSNEEYIEVLYQTFFGRTGDEAGKEYWLSILNGNGRRDILCASFAASAEFTEICNSYGIIRGELQYE